MYNVQMFSDLCEKTMEALTGLGHAVAAFDFLKGKDGGSSHSWQAIFIFCKSKRKLVILKWI